MTPASAITTSSSSAAGSGNSIPGPEFDDLDIAIVEHGKFGGTCLNVGCVPTKMFVHPADLAVGARAGAGARCAR